MGIFHSIKKAIIKKFIKYLLHRFKEKHEAKLALAAADASGAGRVFAPGSGRIISMSLVPDDVYGEGNLGDGCGVLFTEDTLVSPVTGTVSATMPGGNVVGITSDEGIEVVLHVGFDETKIRSETFNRLVASGQRVELGEPLISFERDAGCDYLAILAIANTDEYAAVNVLAGDRVSVGEEVIETVAKDAEPSGSVATPSA